MKRIVLLFLSLLILSLSGTVMANEKQAVTIFYCVDDTILQAQNSKEDVEKGKVEFEKAFLDNFDKRFDINGVKRIHKIETSADLKYDRDQLYNIPANQVPVLVELKVTGLGTETDTYQNAFGAKSNITVPNVNIHYTEYLGERITGHRYMFQTFDGDFSYRPQSYALGRDLYVANKDDRTLVKNCVRGLIRDIGKFNPPNKYAYPDKYERYSHIYYGDYKYIVEHMQNKP
ncbi:MAG: hypothetical protein H6Q72_1924 [Firmicutes bacterium]|nr:hypothetical protein [Bacillota bacterium]